MRPIASPEHPAGTVTLIDYGMGNLRSVAKAFEFLGAGVAPLTSGPAALARTSGIVLPGVGNFGDGMRELRARDLVGPLLEAIAAGTPFLGICLGMQLLLEESEEAPGVAGLGVFPGKVVRFPPGKLKVPHMGWNQVHRRRQSPLLDGIADGSWCYFVHSYYPVPEDDALVLATSDHGLEFPAVIGREHVFATQFHPEKSQDVGLAMLRNFLALTATASGAENS